MTDSETDAATRTAIDLGLDPRGFPASPSGFVTRSNPVVVPEGMDYVPWDTPAVEVMSAEFCPDDLDESETDDDYSLIDWLTDFAGARGGMGLTEFLGYLGIGPEAEDDEDDEGY